MLPVTARRSYHSQETKAKPAVSFAFGLSIVSCGARRLDGRLIDSAIQTLFRRITSNRNLQLVSCALHCALRPKRFLNGPWLW
ncbi:uncharacterized protein K441DRAFT_665557 [Cenococcum geophilum 1.58]|uniref:uncharacterized protein n=1 Tax=Cenococcum geophilum 1.58 TaxID=794803 RepID=UPI00358E3082|nr:hypothetical protein K441DRAFT_665557 [Cenococcum geophilum 1.58]